MQSITPFTISRYKTQIMSKNFESNLTNERKMQKEKRKNEKKDKHTRLLF